MIQSFKDKSTTILNWLINRYPVTIQNIFAHFFAKKYPGQNQWKAIDTELAQLLARIRKTFSAIRKLLKEIGSKAQVDIEPEKQTKLIDETLMIPGVLICGVPGAGGNDALFAIFLKTTTVETNLESFWEKNGVVTLPITESEDGIRLTIQNDQEEKKRSQNTSQRS